MPDRPRGLSGRLAGISVAVENAALVVLLGALMIVAVGQIAMRLFFSSGFVWADELTKLMVLWIALIASIAASRSDRHLSIDVLSHVVPARLARLPKAIASGFAAGICGLLAWESWRYVALAKEFGDTLLVDVPAWAVYAILPAAFALMTWNFLRNACIEAWRLARPPAEESA